jgi:hypothetical protein
MQEFLEALSSYYFDKKSLLNDEEFENLREVRLALCCFDAPGLP